MKSLLLVPLVALFATSCSPADNGNAIKTAGQEEHVDAPGTAPHDHDDPAGHKGSDMAMTAPMPGDSPATRSYKASMATMMQSLPAYTNDADVDFNRQMRVHHQAAIDMAEAQLANGRDAETKALAREIVGAQKAEIARINAWLAKRGS